MQYSLFLSFFLPLEVEVEKARAQSERESGLALAEGRSGGRGDSHCNRTGRLPRVNGSQGQSIPAF